MNRQKIIVVDHQRCLGCQSCRLACGLAHSPAMDLIQLSRELGSGQAGPVWPRLSLEVVDGKAVPLQCRHCREAPCLAVCPTGALSRPAAAAQTPGGLEPVVFNTAACIGCRACLLVCPFGLIRLAPDKKTLLKCDLCSVVPLKGALYPPGGTQAGQEHTPACVQACPTHALGYGTFDGAGRGPYLVAFKRELERLCREKE